MTFAFKHSLNLDFILDVRIIQVEWPRTEHNPMLLIIFLKLFRVSTQINRRRAPVRIKGLQLHGPIILTAVIVDGDLPKV
jgi:hypothetical protein